MNLEIVEFKPDHVRSIMEKNGVSSELIDECLKAYLSAGSTAYTLLENGQVVCCGGIVNLHWNRGEVWIIPGSLFLRHIKKCFKDIERYMGRIVNEKGYKRLHALIDPLSDINCHFIHHLGFVLEGELKKFGPKNNDLLMFARTYE